MVSRWPVWWVRILLGGGIAGAGARALIAGSLTERAKRTRRDVDTHLAALHDLTARQWREVLSATSATSATSRQDRGQWTGECGQTVQGWTRLVLPRNIKRGYLSHEELDTVGPEVSAKLVYYGLRPGDIVCARSGTLGLMREAKGGWLAAAIGRGAAGHRRPRWTRSTSTSSSISEGLDHAVSARPGLAFADAVVT